MIIAIWGRSGAGKSLMANEIGRHYARRAKVTVVVDTDMTQPTLPPRLPGMVDDNKASLGAIYASTQVRDAQIYFHQHHKGSNLFYAGLKKDDNYLSYEIGMRQYSQAFSFLTACRDVADVIILDCSSQRGDPFLAAALDMADRFLLVHTPDTKNLCWYLGVKPLFLKTRSDRPGTILHVANAVQKYHATSGSIPLGGTQKHLGRWRLILLENCVPKGVPTDIHDVHYMHQTTMIKPFVMHTIAKRARLLIKVSGVRISGGSPRECRIQSVRHFFVFAKSRRVY